MLVKIVVLLMVIFEQNLICFAHKCCCQQSVPMLPTLSSLPPLPSLLPLFPCCGEKKQNGCWGCNPCGLNILGCELCDKTLPQQSPCNLPLLPPSLVPPQLCKPSPSKSSYPLPPQQLHLLLPQQPQEPFPPQSPYALFPLQFPSKQFPLNLPPPSSLSSPLLSPQSPPLPSLPQKAPAAYEVSPYGKGQFVR